MPTVKTAISIEGELLKDITRRARKAGVSRSRYIADAVQAHMRSNEKHEMIRQIERAYRQPDPKEQQFLKAAKAKFRKIVEGTW